MKKKEEKSGFPNKQFNSSDAYHIFAVEHNVFGRDAYELKKKLDKQTKIPEPKIERLK